MAETPEAAPRTSAFERIGMSRENCLETVLAANTSRG